MWSQIDQTIDLDHALVMLANTVNRRFFEEFDGVVYAVDPPSRSC